jgi:hypothetical protein
MIPFLALLPASQAGQATAEPTPRKIRFPIQLIQRESCTEIQLSTPTLPAGGLSYPERQWRDPPQVTASELKWDFESSRLSEDPEGLTQKSGKDLGSLENMYWNRYPTISQADGIFSFFLKGFDSPLDTRSGLKTTQLRIIAERDDSHAEFGKAYLVRSFESLALKTGQKDERLSKVLLWVFFFDSSAEAPSFIRGEGYYQLAECDRIPTLDPAKLSLLDGNCYWYSSAESPYCVHTHLGL